MSTLVKERPCPVDFFNAMAITVPRKRISLKEFLRNIPAEHLAEFSLAQETQTEQCLDLVEQMEKISVQKQNVITEVAVKGGHDKRAFLSRTM